MWRDIAITLFTLSKNSKKVYNCMCKSIQPYDHYYFYSRQYVGFSRALEKWYIITSYCFKGIIKKALI